MRKMILGFAVAIMLMAASAQAQGAVWSATFTPGDVNGDAVGCRNGDDDAECSNPSILSDDEFTVDGVVYTVTEFYQTSGTNRIYFAGIRSAAHAPWTDIADELKIGSTSLDIGYAFLSQGQNRPLIWRLRWSGDPGLDDVLGGDSLTDGTSISVTLISGDLPPPPLTCEEGEEVADGVCVPIPPPPPPTCEAGEEVVNGVCVTPPPPPPPTCEAGEELVNGVCVTPPPPPPPTCEAGEELVNGVCVTPPPPPPPTCEAGEELVNGVCVTPPPPPPPTCEAGEELVNGVCVTPPPPPPPTCEAGEELVNGVCVAPPPPPPLTCEEGEEVVDGVCVTPPLTCEAGEEEVGGVCVPIPPPPLTCDSDPNADNMLSINERFDTLPRPCAVSVDGKIRAILLSEGGAIAIQSDLDSDVIHPSIEMRKGDKTIPGATAVFWCIADAEGSIWHTSETDATVITVECGKYSATAAKAAAVNPHDPDDPEPDGDDDGDDDDCDDGDCPQTLTTTPTMPEAAVVCLALLMIGAGARQLRRRVA